MDERLDRRGIDVSDITLLTIFEHSKIVNCNFKFMISTFWKLWHFTPNTFFFSCRGTLLFSNFNLNTNLNVWRVFKCVLELVVWRGSPPIMMIWGLIDRKQSITTFPLTDWMGSTTIPTAREFKASNDCWVFTSTPENLDKNYRMNE